MIEDEYRDPDRHWSVLNARAAALVIVVLLAGIAAGALGLGWGTWLGYGAGAVAALGVLVNMWRGFSGPPASTAAPAERRRVARCGGVIRSRPRTRCWPTASRGRDCAPLGVSSWGGPLIAAGQLDAIPFRGTSEGALQLVLLVLALGVGVGALWTSARARRSLVDQSRGAGPTD